MLPAPSVDEILTTAARKFENGTNRLLVGVLFAPADLMIVRSEVLPSLNRFDIRTGQHFHVFLAGYSRFGDESWGRPVTQDRIPWQFSVQRFEDIRKQFGLRSKWRYDGGVRLLLVDVVNHEDEYPEFDFQDALDIDCLTLQTNAAVPSLSALIERLAQYAEDCRSSEGEPNTSEFSDSLISRHVTITNIVLGLIPENLRQPVQGLTNFGIRNLS